MTEKKNNGSGGKTRREFLKDAGLLVGGTAIGSTVLLAACGGGETETVTNTVTNTATVTATESRFLCPTCSMEFNTLVDLQAHFDTTHPTEEAIPGVVTLNVNGKTYVIHVKSNWTLLYVLREILGLPGAKDGCDRGECGTCTVIVDDMAIYSCMMLAIEADGSNIMTIEGLSDGITLHSIQQAFFDNDASQCGYCIPGFLMMTKALLDENPNPTLDEVREGISGNICQCGNTKKIVQSVMAAKGGI